MKTLLLIVTLALGMGSAFADEPAKPAAGNTGVQSSAPAGADQCNTGREPSKAAPDGKPAEAPKGTTGQQATGK